jgi:hypothetical protein
MPSYLLDKSIARRIVEALYHLEKLSSEEMIVLDLWHHLQVEGARLFVPTEAVHILQRFAHLVEIGVFLSTVEPFHLGRYVKRWARRLRRHGFTREDALVLALATYGTDSTGDILGVDGLITLDKPLLNHFRVHQAELQTRLLAMTRQFSRPYCRATLPVVLHPDRFFKEASSGGLPHS